MILPLIGSVALLVLLADFQNSPTRPMMRFSNATKAQIYGTTIWLLLHSGRALIVSAFLVTSSMVAYGLAQ